MFANRKNMGRSQIKQEKKTKNSWINPWDNMYVVVGIVGILLIRQLISHYSTMKRSHPFWTANLFDKKMREESLVKCWTLRELRGSVDDHGVFVYDGKVKGDCSSSGNLPFFFSSRKWWGFVNGEWESEQKGRERVVTKEWNIWGWVAWLGVGVFHQFYFYFQTLLFRQSEICMESDVLLLWMWVRSAHGLRRREVKVSSFLGHGDYRKRHKDIKLLDPPNFGYLECSPGYSITSDIPVQSDIVHLTLVVHNWRI